MPPGPGGMPPPPGMMGPPGAPPFPPNMVPPPGMGPPGMGPGGFPPPGEYHQASCAVYAYILTPLVQECRPSLRTLTQAHFLVLRRDKTAPLSRRGLLADPVPPLKVTSAVPPTEGLRTGSTLARVPHLRMVSPVVSLRLVVCIPTG